MSTLTNKLNYILAWLESLNPDFVDCYNPGLSWQQIDEIIKEFPFNLSEEIYELYQWRNGFAFDYNLPLEAFLFPEHLCAHVPITFCSLQDSVYIYNLMQPAFQINIDSEEYEYWNPKWLPIGAYEVKRILYVIGNLNPSPVCLWEVASRPKQVRVYKSLTSMISVIAECCEFGLYKLIPDEYGEEDDIVIRIDEEKLELEKEIYQKYNS